MKQTRFFLLATLLLFLLLHASASAKTILQTAVGNYDEFSESLQRFEHENPNIEIVFNTAPDIHGWLIEQLLQQGTKFDIYRLSSETNLREKLIQRGFCQDISLTKDQLRTVNAFFPVVRDSICSKEKLFFIPTSIHFPYQFTVNTKLLFEIGMTTDDLPSNLSELFEFIHIWNESYVDEYPEITPFYTHGFGYVGINDFVGLVMDMYRDAQILTDGRLNYDTDIFRTLMCEVQKYTVPVSARKHGDWIFDKPQENKCLIYCRSLSTDSFLEQSESKLLVPLSISADYAPFQPFSLELAFINPYSTKKDEAENFLSYYLDYPDPVLLCAISQELAGPVQNSSFEESRAQWIKSLDTAKTKLEHATPSEKAELEDTIKFMQDCLDHQEDYQYRVSQASLDDYHEKIVPYLAPRGNTPFDTHLINSNIKSLVSQYLDGAINIEELVKQLKQTVTLLYLEDQ